MSFKIHKVLTLPETGVAGDWYLLKINDTFKIYVGQIDGTLIENVSDIPEDIKLKIESLPTEDDLQHVVDAKLDKVKLFYEFTPDTNKIVIDNNDSSFTKINLTNPNISIYDLNIINVNEGESGKLLIFHNGSKRIILDSSIIGTLEVPISASTNILCSYEMIKGHLYLDSTVITGDYNETQVSTITDLVYTYYDNSTATLKWTAPYAKTVNIPVSYYEIRYSNNIVDPTVPSVWNSLVRLENNLIPKAPGELETYSIDIKSNTEYYFYIKSVKIQEGVISYSNPSNSLFIKTSGANSLPSRPYNIPLSLSSIYPKHFNYVIDSTTKLPTILENLIDEKNKNQYLDTGYLDLTNSTGYQTYWHTYRYSVNAAPFNIDIDLYQQYKLDRIYLLGNTSLKLTIKASSGFGNPWEKVGEFNTAYRKWGSVDFGNKDYRFIRLSYDIIDFGADYNRTLAQNEEFVPIVDEKQYGSVEGIQNMLIYGTPLNKPDKIREPLRRLTTKRTVDEFFCVNGHAYQQGRIHSIAGGSTPRLYINFNQFSQYDSDNSTLLRVDKISDLRFRNDNIQWVSGNSGTGRGLEYNLTDTYKRYGLKPFLTNTSLFDICRYTGLRKQNGTPYNADHTRPTDNMWLPGKWIPKPSRGFDGLTRYYNETMNPQNYKTYGRLAESVSRKYGNNSNSNGLSLNLPHEIGDIGTDLIRGIEIENEPDQNWSGWINCAEPEEVAALLSAVTDGHAGSLYDENGVVIKGIKSSDLLSIAFGTAGSNKGYLFSAIHWWKSNRPDGNVPADVYSIHNYYSSVGDQGSNNTNPNVTYAVPADITIEESTTTSLKQYVELRDRLTPTVEVWLTEFGFGEGGKRESKSPYQCYSLPGRIINGWTIPDRHRSEVKGAWTVRACLKFMEIGIDMVNYYSTETEQDFFTTHDGGTGGGFEMFDWYNLTDNTPSAKYNSIQQYEVPYSRGGFSAMGLFGNILNNGAYPITNSFWWTSTFRNVLKGFKYKGKKSIKLDSKVKVYVFYNEDTNKSAYVVYYCDQVNTGVTNITIPVPDSVSNVTHVKTYLPKLTDPRIIPVELGADQDRTGIPTSRRERYENGQWIRINRPIYWGSQYGSITERPAVYPENPIEGQEIAILPTPLENPYFPIVGPVAARYTSNNTLVNAQSYEVYDAETQTYSRMWNTNLAWRQVDAICDYILYSEEGIKGRSGISETINKSNGGITINISEFPEYYIFDGEAECDFESKVTDVTSVSINSSTIELWWNNNSIDDEGYEIFSSTLPDSGFTLMVSLPLSTENTYRIQNLNANTTYYFKIRPIKGTQKGEFSESIGAKTLANLTSPTSLRLKDRTTNSIKLEWDYEVGQTTEFSHYEIQRSASSTSFRQVAIINGIQNLTYEDVGLSVNKEYNYKIRAVGLNGVSEYTEPTTIRTLRPDEMPPAVKQVATNKLGTKITITFDADVKLIDSEHSFIVEVADTNADSRVPLNYTSLEVDTINKQTVTLRFPLDVLPSYNSGKLIYLSYNGSNIQTDFLSVPLKPFTNIRIINSVNDFTGILNVWNLNFTDAVYLANSYKWNDLVVTDPSKAVFTNLKNAEGITTSLGYENVHNAGTFRWGLMRADGITLISNTEVPTNVAKQVMAFAYTANEKGNVTAKSVLTGLNNEKLYNIKAYGGTIDNSALYKRPAKMNINGISSSVIEQSTNRTEYMVINGVKPINNSIEITFTTMYPESFGNVTVYPGVNWMIIEEYENPTEAINKEVLLRDFTINEVNYNNEVITKSVTINNSVVGAFNKYRVAEDGDIENKEWITLPQENSLEAPYTISSNLESVELTVQVANNLYESEPVTKTFTVKSTFGLSDVVLNINGDDSITSKRNLTVALIYTGDVTEYAIQESSDFENAVWLPLSKTIDFLLSDKFGVKTVYVKVKNNTQISDTVVKTIRLVSDVNERFLFDLNDNVNVNSLTVTELTDKTTGLPIGIYANTLNVFNENTNVNYGSYQLYNSMGEKTYNVINFNTDKYPINTASSYKFNNSYLNIKASSAITDAHLATFPYPLNLISSNKYPKLPISKDSKSRISFTLLEGTYRMSFISAISDIALAFPGWTNASSWFTIYDENGSELVKANPGNASFQGLNNNERNVNLDFTLTRSQDITLVINNSTYTGAPIFNTMELIRNYVHIDPLEVLSLTMSGNPDTTTTENIRLMVNYKGLPSHYRIAESEAELLNKSWTLFEEIIDFTISSSSGTKTLYFQLKSYNEDVITPVFTTTIIKVNPNAIALNDFKINNDDAYGSSKNVTLNISTSTVPTHYKVATTSADLNTAEWIPYTTDAIPYTSNDYGTLTLYLQVKDSIDSSNILNDFIVLVEPFVFNDVILGNNSGSGSSLTQTINLSHTGSVTAYRISEIEADLSTKEWVPWTGGTFNYTFETEGTKTIYAQIKNQLSESVVKSSSITVTVAKPTYYLGFNGTSYNTLDVPVSNGLYYNQTRYSMNASYAPFNMTEAFTGVKSDTITFNLNPSYYTVNAAFAANYATVGSYYKATVASGIHALDMILNQSNVNSTASPEPDVKKSRYSFTLKPGQYRFRILTNSQSGQLVFTEASRTTTWFALYKGALELVKVNVSSTPNWTGLNNQDFNASMTITVTDPTTVIDLGGWSTTANNRPPINLIEITKLS